jgi:predicted deacylase
LTNPKKILVITTGQHGAEGIVGSAILKLFLKEYLFRLDPQDTGLLLVHAINPWGMEHNRRVNPNNVDLNRNFLSGETTFTQAGNQSYRQLNTFFNPKHSLRGGIGAKMKFYSRLIRILFSPGEAVLRAGFLGGQYEFPQGVYFGGQQIEEETRVMMRLLREVVQEYSHILHLDMHSGYGPRYQMSLVNSTLEPRSSQELQQAFYYPLAVSTTPDEFYSMQGDMIEWLYQLVQNEFPEKQLFATAFEFGTFGDTLLAGLRSLRAIISENQLYWHGAASDGAARKARTEFSELFCPTEKSWREKAVEDARKAFEGILSAEKFL